MSLLKTARRLFRRAVNGLVETTPEGVSFKAGALNKAIRWDEIVRIEVVRRPTLTVEDFSAILVGAKHSVVVYDRAIGFNEFEERLLERWPEIRERWNAVYTGSPNWPERGVLWERNGLGRP